MASEIKVPNAGESITSAVISTWHKQDGDAVQTGDALVTIDTDKVSTELAAEATGTLKIGAQPGEEVKIGAVIGWITAGVAAPVLTAPATLPAPAPEPVKAPAAETAKPLPAPAPIEPPALTDRKSVV